MGLYIEFVNISELKPVSDYRVRVYVNYRKIAGDFLVKDHVRDDGWFKLLEKFVDEQKVRGK